MNEDAKPQGKMWELLEQLSHNVDALDALLCDLGSRLKCVSTDKSADGECEKCERIPLPSAIEDLYRSDARVRDLITKVSEMIEDLEI